MSSGLDSNTIEIGGPPPPKSMTMPKAANTVWVGPLPQRQRSTFYRVDRDGEGRGAQTAVPADFAVPAATNSAAAAISADTPTEIPGVESTTAPIIGDQGRKCLICSEDFEDREQLERLACGHQYCKACLDRAQETFPGPRDQCCAFRYCKEVAIKVSQGYVTPEGLPRGPVAGEAPPILREGES